jgi:hypothetical protein
MREDVPVETPPGVPDRVRERRVVLLSAEKTGPVIDL